MAMGTVTYYSATQSRSLKLVTIRPVVSGGSLQRCGVLRLGGAKHPQVTREHRYNSQRPNNMIRSASSAAAGSSPLS